MKRNKLLLTALAVILAMGVMIAPGYGVLHGTYRSAGGGNDRTWLRDYDQGAGGHDNAKTVVISNKGPESCYVRVQAFTSDGIKVNGSGSDWTKDGDWWYYNGIVEADGKTPELELAFELPEGARKASTSRSL